jgi:signal transduction protein with GAF and PtsI domain
MVLSMPLRAKMLDDAERERLQKALQRIERAEQDFAVMVRRIGIAACARELGITRQAVANRLKTVDGRSRRGKPNK